MKKNFSIPHKTALKSLLALMIPVMFGNLLQTAYNLTDTFWVGRLGKEAVAAVSISFPIIFFIVSLSAGFAFAGSILVSQYKGRNDNYSMNKVVGQTFITSIFLSLVFSIIGYLFAPELIGLLGAEAGVSELAVSYLRYSMIGFVFIFGYAAFQEMFRGAGDAKTPFYIVLVTVLLNLVLDPLFIFGYKSIPAFGVSGAAVSTIATQGIAFFIAIIVMRKEKHGIKLKSKNLIPDFVLIKRLFKLGLPTSLEQTSRSIDMILMIVIVSFFGTTVLAGYGIGTRINSFVIIPAISLAISSAVLVGQRYGADKKESAFNSGRAAQKLGFFSLLVFSFIFMIFSKQIVSAFIPNEPETIAVASRFLRIISLSYPLIGIQMASLGAFRGAGKTKLSMVVSLVVLSVQLSLAYFLSHYTALKEVGIWISYVIAQVVGVLIILPVYRKKNWLK